MGAGLVGAGLVGAGLPAKAVRLQASSHTHAIAGLWQFVKDSPVCAWRSSCLQARGRSTLRIHILFMAGVAGPTYQALTSP